MKCGDLFGEYMNISILVLFSDTLLALGNSAISVVIGHLGASYVAAQSITKVTLQLATVMNQGFSQTAAIITGHTIGEGKKEQAQRPGYGFWLLGMSVGVFACVLILLTKNQIIGFYRVQDTTNAIANGMMSAVSITVLFSTTDSILTKGVLRGGGDTKFLLVADVVFVWLLSLPLGYCAGYVWGLSPFWIYIFLKSDQIVKAFWCISRLRSRKWIKEIK